MGYNTTVLLSNDAMYEINKNTASGFSRGERIIVCAPSPSGKTKIGEKPMIIHVRFGEKNEYFLETDERGLDYTSFKAFLLRRYEEAPEYWKPEVLHDLVVVEKLNALHHGFPVIDSHCTGASRNVLIDTDICNIFFQVISVQKLEGE